MIVKNPKTNNVTIAQINPSGFLLLMVVNTANKANNVTRAKIITVPMSHRTPFFLFESYVNNNGTLYYITFSNKFCRGEKVKVLCHSIPLHVKFMNKLFIHDRMNEKRTVSKMEWKKIPLGLLQTNCYVLYNQQKECIIFDPGAEGDKLIGYLEKEQLHPQAILLTHAHFDHIGAVDEVRQYYNIPVYVHERESRWLTDPSLNGSQLFMNGRSIIASPPDRIIKEEDVLSIDAFTFKILETPGHSPGSVSYYVKEINTIFAGDTLFQGSIGRTDLPGGNHEQLLNSIEEKLLTLPNDTLVLPGHGPVTTIEKEIQFNPFINGY